MYKYITVLLVAIAIGSCKEAAIDNRTENFPKTENLVAEVPSKENVWVFILAGQSNMAGRAFVEPKDTITSNRILTINKENQLIYAKEPLHFYEPTMSGLDMGMTFGRELLKSIPDSVSILLIPTAVGGSSMNQWLNDKEHRGVQLFSNFQEKMKLGSTYGNIQGVLWLQGETDAENENSIRAYSDNLNFLIKKFRKTAQNPHLPVVIGELGSYSENSDQWAKINTQIRVYSEIDTLVRVVTTKDLKDRGDRVHFNSESIRLLGKRYSDKFIEIIKN